VAGISSIELKQILETNAKAVEVYLEVSSQYEVTIKLLEEMRGNNLNNERCVEKILERVKEFQEKNKEAFESLIDENEKYNKQYLENFSSLSEDHEEILKLVKERFSNIDNAINASTNSLDKSIYKLIVLLSSSAVVTLGGVAAKVFGLIP
jgi:predicted nuclease with TOPRIM domain